MLKNPNKSYLLLEPVIDSMTDYENKMNCERLCSVLWSKEYQILPAKNYENSIFKDCFVGISTLSDNDEIRKESLDIINFLNLESGIVKYIGETELVKLYKNGQEEILELKIYESSDNSKLYIMDGISFSFEKKVRYFYPKKKEHLKKGIVVEYFNNNKWTKKTIENLDSEYEKLYKLLIQYEKLRLLM